MRRFKRLKLKCKFSKTKFKRLMLNLLRSLKSMFLMIGMVELLMFMIRTKALITNNNDVQHRINNDNNNNNVQWDINNDNNDNIQHDTNNNKCRHHHHQGRDSTYIGSYIHYNDHLADTT